MSTRPRPGIIPLRPARPCRGACGLAAWLMLLSWPWIASADDSPTPEATGTIALFDGKTLDGWKVTDFYGAGEVKVDDGAIVMTAGRSMSGITSTRQDLPRTDYELGYEAMRIDGRDFFAAATFPVGDAHLTLVNGGWGGNVTGISSINGADASENETGRYFPYENGTWYRFRVRVTDTTIRCWIDDEEVVALNHEGRHLGTRIETRKSEPLGFATWETSGAVRRITLRRLTPEEVAATHVADE